MLERILKKNVLLSANGWISANLWKLRQKTLHYIIILAAISVPFAVTDQTDSEND